MRKVSIPGYPALRSSVRLVLRRENLLLDLLAVPLGICCGYIAVLLRLFILLLQNVFFYQKFSLTESQIVNNTLGWWILWVPAIGGIFVGIMVYHIAMEAKGHGVPEVMEALIINEGKIRPRVVMVKAVASGLCIASGGATGREGPIVQVGSALGSNMGQWMKLRPGLIKVLVGCGAAASIAATFNTPIAGVIFAFEVLLFEFKTRSFVPLVIATVFATIVSRIYLGNEPAFHVPSYHFVHPIELVFYLVLGLFAGLLAIVIVKSLYGLETIFDRMRIPNFMKPALGGLGVGLIGIFCPQVMGVGYDTVDSALQGSLTLKFLLLLVLLKVIALSLTLGSGGSGGVFAPNLFIGAMLGGAFGVGVNYLFPSFTGNPGAYALVGMAAVFAGVSRATLTAIIILFEMTLDYHIILPLMFACVVADGVAWALSRDTIYTKKLTNRGIFVDMDMEVNPLELNRVRDFMTASVDTVQGNDKVQTVWNLLQQTDHHGFPVLNSRQRLIGIITETELRKALRNEGDTLQVKDVMASKLIVTYPDENLNRAFEKMMFHKISHLPVVSRTDTKKMVGFLTRTDIMHALRKSREG